jgi:anaerobic selenocysteine-containing dehydrogenase
MIERGWYDRDFIRDWSNGPMLVRADTGRLLTERDLTPDGDPTRAFAWDSTKTRLVAYDTTAGRYGAAEANLALEGEYRVGTPQGEVVCHPVFELYARLCRRYSPEVIEATCWIPRAQVEETARLIWHARPVSYYAWSGHEQHANVTQTARAMSLLYALTGSFDSPGGKRAVPDRACCRDHRGRPALREEHGPPRSASASDHWVRPAGATSPRAISTAPSAKGTRTRAHRGRLRRQHAACPRRRHPRARGAPDLEFTPTPISS